MNGLDFNHFLAEIILTFSDVQTIIFTIMMTLALGMAFRLVKKMMDVLEPPPPPFPRGPISRYISPRRKYLQRRHFYMVQRRHTSHRRKPPKQRHYPSQLSIYSYKFKGAK